MAAKAGAHHVLNPKEHNVVADCRALTGGEDLGVDVSFDCAGLEVTINAAIAALRPKGVCVNVAIWRSVSLGLAGRVLLMGPFFAASSLRFVGVSSRSQADEPRSADRHERTCSRREDAQRSALPLPPPSPL